MVPLLGALSCAVRLARYSAPTAAAAHPLEKGGGPPFSRGCSSVGRAPALQAGGHRFDPVHLHHEPNGFMVCRGSRGSDIRRMS
jgi:hypothetical protein